MNIIESVHENVKDKIKRIYRRNRNRLKKTLQIIDINVKKPFDANGFYSLL